MSLNKTLEDGWFFTQLTGHEHNESTNKGTDIGEWLPVNVPTGVYEELLRVSRIPDPFIGQLLGLSPSYVIQPHHVVAQDSMSMSYNGSARRIGHFGLRYRLPPKCMPCLTLISFLTGWIHTLPQNLMERKSSSTS
jgi:hypothetical protein